MLMREKELPLVSMAFMNEVHKEDIAIINELFELVLSYEKEANSTNEMAITKKYIEWTKHTLAHFKGEEEKMLELNFPAYSMHKQSHDEALVKMDSVFSTWKNEKDVQALKIYLIEELPAWLTQHIETMDTVTAMFFNTGLSPCSISHVN